MLKFKKIENYLNINLLHDNLRLLLQHIILRRAAFSAYYGCYAVAV
jgi:hypothetical protein